MANELRTSVVMDLRGNLERQARRYEGAMRGLATSGQRHMGRLSRATAGAGRMLDRVGNRWTALATGAAGFGTVRNLVALEERFTRLGIQAGKSEEQMDALREKIFETARQPEIRVDPAQITSAIEAIVEKTGDLEFAEQNIRNIGAAISATGAQGGSIGEILAEFQKMDIKKPEAVMNALDTLNQQGKSGAFTLQNLASLGPRVVTAYTALGRQGPQAIREMGAALQVIRQGTGSSEQAATAFEALLRTFQNAEKAKQLAQQSGVQIFDPEELEQGREVLRPVNELIVDIVEAADGRSSLLSGVFDAEAMRAFNAALGEYNRTGAVESMQRFLDVQGDGSATMEDSARAAETAGGALRNLSSAWQSFADSNLSEHIQAAADALNSLDQETVDRWLKIAGMAAGGIGGLYALRSLGRLGVDLGRGAKGIWGAGRSTTGGIAGNGGLGGIARQAAPLPVYVTNWGSMPGGRSAGRTTRKGGGYTPPTTQSSTRTTGTGTSGTPRTRGPRLSAKALAGASVMGGAALPVASAGLAGWSVGSMINETLERSDTGRAIGDKIGEAVARVLATFGNDNAQRALRANGDLGTINVKVDQDGRVRDVIPERGENGPEIDLDVGNWGVWP
ncbi:phage tail tape measure protein [Chromohalobacter israelensis]|uniref:phage tail tape measure protein n=1 Tax=Chromohalobacter israelensis TaxID=141390 RepID=UPI000FFECE37|nr:phage tail tape measure protein [Chromohalobacter salexigens]RXE49217.1 hypothetical protein B4O83_15070 [Chromohalobacter salexigens]